MDQVWRPVRDAPLGVELQLSVIDAGEVHAVVFPCLYTGFSWVAANDGRRIAIRPTHWRFWEAALATPPSAPSPCHQALC